MLVHYLKSAIFLAHVGPYGTYATHETLETNENVHWRQICSSGVLVITDVANQDLL